MAQACLLRSDKYQESHGCPDGPAIAVQAALSIALMLLAQSFQQLFSLTLFAEYVFYMAATASVFIFRVKDPDAARSG